MAETDLVPVKLGFMFLDIEFILPRLNTTSYNN